MPHPPQIDDLTKISFITNYFLQGCRPPYSLIVEFSREPQKDLWILLFGLDLDDIVKDWLRPGGGRRRAAGRHGRKRRRLPSLDPNDYVGGIARDNLAPMYPGIKLPGAKAVFFIADEVDRLNFTVAVLEGLTDLGFETLWGLLKAHPELCPQMSFVEAHRYDPEPFVGIAPPQTPVGWQVIDAKQNFEGPLPWLLTDFDNDFTVSWAGTILAISGSGMVDGRLTVRSDTLGVLGESSYATIEQGERVTLAVEAEVPAGEFVYCARTVESGSIEIEDAKLFGFSGTWL